MRRETPIRWKWRPVPILSKRLKPRKVCLGSKSTSGYRHSRTDCGGESERPSTIRPVGVLLGKIDKETNQNKPQGSASLEGAEFTVKYYKTEPTGTQDPAEQGKVAERQLDF